MDTLQILLPKKLKEFAERQVAGGKYADVSDYLRDILRKDQERQAAIAHVQAALDEGEASGYVPFDPDEFLTHLLTLEPRNAA